MATEPESGPGGTEPRASLLLTAHSAGSESNFVLRVALLEEEVGEFVAASEKRARE